MANRPNSPLRGGYDYSIVTPELLTEDVHRASFGDTTQGGLVNEAAKGLRRYMDNRATGSLAEQALDAELAGNTSGYDRLMAERALRLNTSAPDAPRVGGFTDIGSVGDAVDWAGSTFGEGVPSLVPTIAGAAAGRFGLGRLIGNAPAAALGGAVPAYGDIRRGEIEAQYDDPALAATSAEDRSRTATLTAALGTGLEVLLPTRIVGGMGRGVGGIARRRLDDVATEALAEGGQDVISQVGQMGLDPSREFSTSSVIDSAAAGALVGGAVGTLGRPTQDTIDDIRGAASGAAGAAARVAGAMPSFGANPPIDLNASAAEAADAADPSAPDDGSGAGGLFDTLNERFGPGLREQAQKTKDYVSDTIDRMGEAVKTAQTPDEFLRQVFSSSTEDAAAADLLHDTEDPGVMNAADPAAAMQQRDAERQERAAFFAEELLNDPATPDAVKERVASFGGDFTDPEARAFVARTLVAQRAGEKLTNAVNDLIDLSKDFGGKAAEAGTDLAAKARGMIDKSMTAAADRIVKKSLQDINEADVAPLVALMAQRLGPTKAVEAPRLARQLVAAANRLSPDARITEETDRRLRNFSEVVDDEVLDLVTELSGSDALRNSIAKIRAIPSARSDVRQSNGQSFLESMLKQPLEPAVMGQLADFVDALGLQLGSMSSERKNQVLGALASAFGSKREAQTVVEYYGNIRRDAFRREAEAGTLSEDRGDDDMSPGEVVATVTNPDGTVSYGAEFGSLTEQDTAEMTASYRDPNPARPFFRGTDRAALRTARRAAPAGSRVASLREYVAQTGESPQAVAARIRADLRKRLTDSENRDTATVQEAIASMEAVPEAARSEDFNQLLSQLKGRKTENRTDLPGLRKQMAAIEKASGVSFKEIADLNRRIRRAELADEGGIDNDDVARLPELRKQLAALENRYSKNAEKVLEKYAVVMRPKDETFASDELMAKFRGILDKLPNANVGTLAERARKRDEIAKIKKTALKFNRKDGKTPITLSAESMAYASQARGSMEERFFDSLAAVLARPDIDGMVPPASDTLISRSTGLTWGDVAPGEIEDTRSEAQKQRAREAAKAKSAVRDWAKQTNAKADFENRAGLMKALRDLQRQFLIDRLGLTIAPGDTLSLTDLIDRFPANQRRTMRTAANELAFNKAVGWAKQLDRKLATAEERNYRDESRMRVLEEYIDEQVKDRHPMPDGDERPSSALAREEVAQGMHSDETGVGGQVADLEAELSVLEDRIDAVAGIRGLEAKYERMVDAVERSIDELTDSVPSAEQRDFRIPGVRAEKTLEQRGDAAAAGAHAPKTSQGKVVKKKSFVGAKSDPQGASDAEKLLGIGAPADVVWRDLGWFRGPDGKLRKEIRSPVLRRRVRDFATAIANGSRDAVKVRDLLAGVDAFKTYLDKLGDLPVDPNDGMVELMGAVGAYNGEDGFSSRGIGISRVNAELAVRIDAFPDGKGIELLRELVDSAIPPELKDMGMSFVDPMDIIAELEARHPMPDVNERVAERLTGTILHELQHAFQHVEGFENGGNATTAVVAKYGDVDEYLAAVRDGDGDTVESITEQAFAQMRAEVGPDGDLEAAAHELYESIVGEVEANDVAARMNLSDEEAASVKPALMDAEREFVRSVLLAEVLSTFRSKVGSSKMGGRPGRPGKNWGDKEAVKAEVLRLRGKDVKVAVEKLVKQLGGSGQYTYDPATGERLIEVAVNARSPVGTARHEAMHDLFRFLSENDATRSVAKDLRDATSAPHVIRQLRDLLKNDKAALEQLNDPEERAAYAYQFWAEDLLQIGPTGTGVFNTIRQFIKDLFGIVTAGQRGEDLMRAFHDGKFADPSIVQEVLQDINDSSGDRVANKLNRAAPALTRALNSLLSAAPERLRRFENDYLNELADKFQPEKGTGFVQNRYQQEGVWTNRLGGILRGTTAVERREAIDQLQAMKPTSKLAKELAKFNEDIYEYMRDAGVQSWDSTTKKFVPLRKVQGYFTRSWDPDAIARNRPEFEALLRTEGGVSAANAAALVENLVRGSEQRPKPKESPVDLGFMPYAPHTSERVLTFINPGNADKFAKFQHKDLADTMMSYVRGSTHRAEYAREFGNNGEKIVDLVAKSGIKDTKELGEISNAVQALEGSLDPGNWSVQTKEAMSAVLTLQNATLLPLALVSQMIDPIVLAARTGDIKDAGTAYVTALKRLKNTITKSKNKVPGEELAEILGVVSEDSTLQAMAMAYGTTRMSKRMENINRVFFKYNGMQGWNNSMRIAATAAGEKYLLAHRKDAKALAELGLEPKDIKSTGGKLDVSSPKVQQAMFQFVDQAVLRPSAANRPVWMSDPRFLLVAHLKQFTFAMHNVVLKRANRELQSDNPKPWGVLMLAMPVILAADMAKFALTGRVPAGWEFKDYVLHAVERSGLLGLGDFGVQAMDRVGSGKMPGEELLGPTFENLMRILRWIGGDPRTDFGDVVDRTVPGARFI